MKIVSLGRSVKRVSVLKSDGSGAIVLHRGKKKRRKKKGSKELRPLEKIVRRSSEDAGMKSYTKLHKKANRKKKDGWAKRMPENIARAAEKGFR